MDPKVIIEAMRDLAITWRREADQASTTGRVGANIRRLPEATAIQVYRTHATEVDDLADYFARQYMDSM